MGQHLDLIGVNIGNFRFRTREFTARFCLNYITGNRFIWIVITNLASYCFITSNWFTVLVNVMRQHLNLVSVNIGNFGFGARELTSWFCLDYITGNRFIWIIITNLAAYCFITSNRLAVLVNVVRQHLDLIGVNISNFGFGTREFTSWFCFQSITRDIFNSTVRIRITNLAS